MTPDTKENLRIGLAITLTPLLFALVMALAVEPELKRLKKLSRGTPVVETEKRWVQLKSKPILIDLDTSTSTNLFQARIFWGRDDLGTKVATGNANLINVQNLRMGDDVLVVKRTQFEFNERTKEKIPTYIIVNYRVRYPHDDGRLSSDQPCKNKIPCDGKV